ncbi:NADH-quinone oxidoreductase subunit NuoF [Sinimarinibacterium flocculans]|uniref:NADH-quinone oxidoreductase subunit F n=1 Tax=Sinimarinibacterium flocculans TaxID=985250 RepID=A0A318E7V6_9GAMM|nr:NADH-quinone oxidoreductase subunit NuoF [Sinimarinibacterium flocculans]PXV66493.1 NADH dehydrogenase subunit F [Sinimarinibacterium flocculans]
MTARTSPPGKPLTDRIRPEHPPYGLADYERHGGFQGLRAALKMAPQDVTGLIKAAGLRGRGGAGFPTGVKWGLVPMGAEAPKQKYIVANGDEMEPGTFKDRLLLEGDPLQFIEGMLIGGYAIGASVGYIFLRAEYVLAAERLRAAMRECRARHLLGRNVLGSGFDFELHLHTSAGRYICGEETALISSLEGKRAIPRAKPPFPATAGLFGKPTVVNNIETLCNVPHIVHYGADWFRGLSKCGDGGTKLYGASGKLRHPGAWELPMGTTVREILDEHAGGMRAGLKLRGFLPGGASTDFLTAEHLDLPMDFDSIAKAGSRMGTGTMIVLDDQTDVIGMVRNLQMFFARESCGWCTPCRDGLPWGEKILAGLHTGRGQPEDLDVLRQLTRWLGPGRTFCAHAPGAMEPLQSALKHFRVDFERAANRGVPITAAKTGAQT